MKQMIKGLLGILVLAACLSSCRNNTPKEARYIPKDAGAVMVLDPQQLQDKLQKGGISVDTLISRVFKNEPADSHERAMFDSMRLHAGINWNEKIYLFLQQKSYADQSSSMTMSVLGSIKDQSTMETFLKSQEHLKDKPIQKEKDFSYVLPHEGTMIAWNDKQLIVTHYMHDTKAVYDTASMTFKPGAPVNLEREMKEQVTRCFTQKSSESMAEVTAFNDMFKDKADGYLFTSTNSLLGKLDMLPIQVPKLEELLKDNYSTATLTFDDGKITAHATGYVNPILAGIIKQYSGRTVDISLLEHYPSSNIAGFWITAFNPELFGGLLHYLEVEGMANDMLQKKIGLTTGDLYKSLRGDIAVIVSDLGRTGVEPQMKTDERSMMRKHTWGKMILIAPIGDKASFSKSMDKCAELGFVAKTGTTYKLAAPLNGFVYLQADEKNLVIASDSATYASYMSGTAKASIPKEVLDRLKGKTGGAYFDIAGTLGSFINDSTSKFNHSLVAAKETFRDMISTSDPFDGNTHKTIMEVRMQNEKQNSLVTLTSLLTDIAIDMRAQAKKERELFPGGVPAIIRTN